MTEQIEGEQISAYLIQKQNSIKAKKLISSLRAENDILNNFIVANKVSDLIFKTIHFHHYTQRESFIIMEVGVVTVAEQKNEQIVYNQTPPRRVNICYEPFMPSKRW
ncbi:unnamed protein product [Meganyctiphanes norvegica]|uniref:Uncharacterized protein n=1 Tax=Meganyctiphanes norvegica TaxID=48144 RepID=A0AAV2QID0_MEGNR